MPAHKSKSEKMDSSKTTVRRDPYEVLGVSRNSTDHEIKSAYRKMALKYLWPNRKLMCLRDHFFSYDSSNQVESSSSPCDVSAGSSSPLSSSDLNFSDFADEPQLWEDVTQNLMLQKFPSWEIDWSSIPSS